MSERDTASRDILIANGFDRYHLLTAAVEAERRGRLERCIAGFYPTEQLGRLGLGRWKRTARLMDRKVDLPDERLVTMPLLETAGHLGGRLLGERSVASARRRFSENARRVVERSGARLYHYRTGFGHRSASAARQKGMATLADHSIAHPGVLAHLVENQGRLPAAGEQGPISLTWRDVMDDLRHADRVLVNSDFVKETFVHQGWDPARVDVIYQGLDESFFDLLERTETPEQSKQRRAEARVCRSVRAAERCRSSGGSAYRTGRRPLEARAGRSARRRHAHQASGLSRRSARRGGRSCRTRRAGRKTEGGRCLPLPIPRRGLGPRRVRSPRRRLLRRHHQEQRLDRRGRQARLSRTPGRSSDHQRRPSPRPCRSAPWSERSANKTTPWSATTIGRAGMATR